MTHARFLTGLFVLALALLASAAHAQAAGPRPRFRVLVVNVPDSNHANSGNAGLAAIRALAAADHYAVDVCVDYGLFTDKYLAPYDVMVWVMAAPLTWSDTSRAAFEHYVTSGRGWIGLHVAALTGISKTPWPWYEDYVGGMAFKGHPVRQNATVKIEPSAATHPILKGVAPEFRVFEEWYSWNRSVRDRPGFTVLASLDESSYDVGNLKMGDHPFAWTNDQYGRMLLMGFGHEPDIYSDPNVRTMLKNAIVWAAAKPVAK
jgi:chitinase